MKRFLTFILLISLSLTAFSQSMWTPVNENDFSEELRTNREIVPDRYQTFELNVKLLKKTLLTAPLDDPKSIEDGILLDIPLADGTLETFKVVYAPIMHPTLAAKFPTIRCYKVLSTDSKLVVGRINTGAFGFRASIRSLNGRVFIDNYSESNENYYISYYTVDHIETLPEGHVVCGVDHTDAEMITPSNFTDTRSAADVSFLRKYRMAVACTGEWGAAQGSMTNAMSKIVTGTNRLTQLYEEEAAITFELVANNDNVVFMDGNTDPYFKPNEGRELIGQNTGVLNEFVGSANYDIGHVFTINCTDGVAGIAALGSVCQNNKGNGVSCVGNSNITNFMISTTAHEVGHQFTATHTWSNCGEENNQNNLSPGTAYEPCSGSTILSYAGGCPGGNNISNGDPYFHVSSFEQMYLFSQEAAGNPCSEKIDINNHFPEVSHEYTSGFTIPISTPFSLTGKGIDEDGDELTYVWEQHDLGPISICGSPIGNAPAFRSFTPTTSPTRVFPSLNKILANNYDKSEVLPTYTRDMEFYFTARDNHPGGGIASWTKVKFSTNVNAGPFFVTSPNVPNETMEVGKTYNVTWDVANTDIAPVNCPRVDIYLSTDAGQTFPYLLFKDTPNDGSENLLVPNFTGTNCRLQIKASNNIFFDINNYNFSIVEPSEPSFYFGLSENYVDVCIPDIIEIDIQSESFLGFDNDIALSATHNLPEGTTVTFENDVLVPSETTKMVIDMTNANGTGEFVIDVVGTAMGSDVLTQSLNLTVVGTDFSDLALVSPAAGVTGIEQVPTFSWDKAKNSQGYTFELGTNPSLGSTSLIFEENLQDTFLVSTEILDIGTLYYWKVTANNTCASETTPLNTFGTEALSCASYSANDLPANISSSGSPTIESLIYLEGAGQVTDVNVRLLQGSHGNTGDLVFTLISPMATAVELVVNKCNFSVDFNMGFDQESPNNISCPLNTGTTYIPVGDLSLFNGESIVGDWILRLEDTNSGDGGQFTTFELDVCSNATLDGPAIANNSGLCVPTGGANALQISDLEVTDANNSDNEIVYTIVRLPSYGSLSIKTVPAVVGDQFTQADINNLKVRYMHDVVTELSDSFDFTVIDGEGGWVDITTFDINVDDSCIVNVNDVDANFAINIFPNPTNDVINIDVKAVDQKDYSIQIFDLKGQLMTKKQIGSKSSFVETMDVSQFNSGIYIVKVISETGYNVSKFTIQR